MMKRITLLLMSAFFTFASYAQNYNYTIGNTFTPLSMEEMTVAVLSAKARFDEYQNKAYKCYKKGEYGGFIYYSDYALGQGFYSSKLYYDRGVAYEKLHEFVKAKKEYKRALKAGCYEAQSALEECKIRQKEWKKSHEN